MGGKIFAVLSATEKYCHETLAASRMQICNSREGL